MTTREENELMTRVEGDAPMGRLMRDNYWIPFAMSAHLVHGDAPMPVRLFGEQLRRVPRRGRPRRLPRRAVPAPPLLAPPRHASRATPSAASTTGGRSTSRAAWSSARTRPSDPSGSPPNVHVDHFPVHEAGGLAWVWLGGGETPPFPELPFGDEDLYRYWCVSRVPCNWLQGLEGSVDSVHAAMLHQTLDRALRRHGGARQPQLRARPGGGDLRDRVHGVRLAGGGAAQDRRRSNLRARHGAHDAARHHHAGGEHRTAGRRGVRHRAGRRHPPSALLRDRGTDAAQRGAARPDQDAGRWPTCPTPPTTRGCGATVGTPGGRTVRSWTPGTSPASGGASSRRTS